MSAAEQLAALVLPARVRKHTEHHLARLNRAGYVVDVERALERAEGFVEGLEVAGALNPGTVEALYQLVDDTASARLAAFNA